MKCTYNRPDQRVRHIGDDFPRNAYKDRFRPFEFVGAFVVVEHRDYDSAVIM